MLKSVLTAALRFRLLLVALAAGLIVLGALSLRQTHVDAVPELASGPVLEVQTEALGLSSQEVEQYVTVPLENNLLDGIMGVWDVRSSSIPGLSNVDLYFAPGTTLLHARQLVEERLTNAYSLPNVSKPPQLIQPLSSSSRVLLVGLTSTTLDPLELSYLARWVVKPRLSGVPGVANVAIFGQQDRQIQVLVDPARLAAQQIALSQVIATAGNAQLVSPLSYLPGSAPGTGGFIDGANQRLEIRPVLPLGAPTDLATVPVSGARGHLPLGRVTKVVEGHQPLIGDAIIDGRSGLVLEVQKLPSASVLGVTKGLDRALQELRPAFAGVKIDTSFFRPATYLSSALDNLWLALIVGAGLALVALVALLLDARSAFVAAMSVATSLVVAALVLKALGETLNALVVLGLLAAAALVVDDAVGTTYRMLAGASEADPAAPLDGVIVDACAELRSTLGYGMLIVLLCTVPVFFAKGLTAIFVHPMFLAFAVAVIASSATALTVTPALGMLICRRSRPHRSRALARRAGETYERALRGALAIPRGAVAGVCCAGLAGLVAFPFLKPPSPPTFVDRNVVIEWQGPAGASLPEMDRVTTRVIAELRALPYVADVAATIGRAVSADRIVNTGSGQIYVSIKHSSNYGRAVSSIRALVEGTPGIYASLSTYEGDVIGGALAPAKRNLVVRVYGEDYGKLSALASRVQTLMAHVNGLGAFHVQLPASEPNIEITVNDAAALRAGVLPGDARRQASTLVSGLTVGNFFEDQAVFDVVVQGVPFVRANLDSVRRLLIDTAGGGHVQLGQIAAVGIRPDPIDIQHEALARYVDVTARVQGGNLGAAQATITRKLERLSLPLAYHAEVLGRTPDDPTSHLVFLSYALAGLVGILLLFQAAFDSWRLAAGVLLAVPVTLAGGLVFALLTGHLATLGADAGLLAVLAFAVRQGMLQVAHIRCLQTRLGETLSATIVVQAAGERLAPSVGGALVAALALLPFAVMGNVAGNEMTHTAAGVFIAGVVIATLVNQLYVPALCLALSPAEPALVSEPFQDDLGIPGLPAPTV